MSLRATLAAEWCETFDLLEGSDGALHVITPFVYPDGDLLPIILIPHEGGWLLTDRGHAVSHLGLMDRDLTDSEVEAAHRMIRAAGLAQRDDLVLSKFLSGPPTIDDLAEFAQVVAQMEVLPLIRKVVEQDRFVDTAKRRVIEWVPEGVAEPNWSPPGHGNEGDLFRSDVRLQGPGDSSALVWMIGDETKAERISNTVQQYRRWEVPGQPVLAVQRGLYGSTSVRRLAVAVGSEAPIVTITSEDSDPLRDRLAQLDIPLRPI